jgi:MOSC domain-containing protein YiiM
LLAVSTPEGLVRKGGVLAVVLKGGIVRPDDLIEVELPPQPHEALTYRVPAREGGRAGSPD